MEETTQIADCVAQQRRCSGPALCSDERRTWQVYHAQSRFSLRRVPHANSGQPRAAGFELAGFRDRVRRLLPRCYGLLTALLDRPQPIRLVLVGIISGRRWDQLRAFFAEMIEATAHRLALHRVRVEGKVGDCRSIEANSDSRPPSTARQQQTSFRSDLVLSLFAHLPAFRFDFAREFAFRTTLTWLECGSRDLPEPLQSWSHLTKSHGCELQGSS